MAYRGYYAGIVVRVLILVILAIITAYGVIIRQWFFTPLVSSILLFIAVLELIRHLNYLSRSLNNFLVAIKQSGFNASFPQKDKESDSLFSTFNEIIKAFQRLAIEKETQYQFLKTLTDNIEAGLIAFDSSGSIKWLNPEAKAVINKPTVNSLNDLKKYQPKLVREIETLKPGQKRLVPIVTGNEVMEISLQLSKIHIEKDELNVALLQNIHMEMELKEVDAWQKLTRVMRHEIMNSMTPIVNLTEAVNKVLSSRNSLDLSDDDFEDIKESLIAIENRSKGLVKFVNAYKDFAKTPEPSISEFSIYPMIEKIHSLLDKDFESKEVDFVLDVKPETLKIQADEELLEQVLINLIRNALEAFGEKGNRIEVFCRKNSGRCLIRVTDNGPGIEPEVLERIFIPFFTTKAKGSGIGLSLSKQIIHQHGGSLTAFSKPGSGTVFTIELQTI